MQTGGEAGTVAERCGGVKTVCLWEYLKNKSKIKLKIKGK
jgi:hypothetical protein